MSDGAAAAVVMSAERARALGLKPMARFVAFATAGAPPEEMGIGPVYAIPKVLKIAGLTLDQIDVIELNEAFAAQSLSVIKVAGLDPSAHQRERRRDRAGPSARLHRSEIDGDNSARDSSGETRDTGW